MRTCVYHVVSLEVVEGAVATAMQCNGAVYVLPEEIELDTFFAQKYAHIYPLTHLITMRFVVADLTWFPFL